MAFFKRNKADDAAGHDVGGQGGRHLVLGREEHCRICNATRMFSQLWLRTHPMRQCPCCGLQFEGANNPYAKYQPVCPQCEEPLEAAGFEYGLCDTCGSKFELAEQSKPVLLPNKNQRDDMAKHGRSWVKD